MALSLRTNHTIPKNISAPKLGKDTHAIFVPIGIVVVAVANAAVLLLGPFIVLKDDACGAGSVWSDMGLSPHTPCRGKEADRSSSDICAMFSLP